MLALVAFFVLATFTFVSRSSFLARCLLPLFFRLVAGVRSLSLLTDGCLRVSGLTIAFAAMKRLAGPQALAYDLIAGFIPVFFFSLSCSLCTLE